jgi:alpha-amylase
MTTKNMGVGFYRGIYDSPYDAFTNYMNILGDFINRVNALYPLDIENDELNALLTTIRNQADEITVKDAEIARLQARLQKYEVNPEPNDEKKETGKAAPAKKAAPKKEKAAKAAKADMPSETTRKKAKKEKAAPKPSVGDPDADRILGILSDKRAVPLAEI